MRLRCGRHWDHNHFVVLTRVGARGITIHDPAIGRRKVPMAEVSRKFTGIALEAWPTDGFARRDETVRISILDMIRRTRGIGAAVAQVLAVSLLLEITVIAMPIGFQLILDEVVVAADRDLLTILVIALAFLLILQVAASFARSWITLLTGSGLALQWKVGLFDHLMRLPLAYYEKRHVGDIVSRFGSLDSIQRTVTASAVTALLDGVMSLALIAMMWLYGGWLLWLALLGVGLYAVLRLSTWGIYRRMSEEAIVHAAQENTHFMESVRGIGSVKVLNLESRRQGTWINHLVERLNAELRVQKFDVYFRSGAASIFGIDRLLIIYFGVMAIIDSAMTVGMFVAFLAYKDQFADRINSFIDTVLQFRMLALHGERIADIAMVVPNYTADKFPLTSVTELPDVYSSSCEGTEKYWNVVKPGGPLSVAEYEPQGLRALFAIAVQPNVIWTTRQVRDMSDLSGLKLYANGAAVNRIARDLGAVPIRLSAPELYDSVTRGTVDGAFFPQSSIVAYGLDEKLRYVVKGTKFGATSWVVAISDRAWGRLPEDVQELLTEAGIKASQAFCAYNDEEIERVNERLTSEGKLTVTTLSEEQVEAWRKATASVSDEWLKDMATAGQDGAAMLKAYRGESD